MSRFVHCATALYMATQLMVGVISTSRGQDFLHVGLAGYWQFDGDGRDSSLENLDLDLYGSPGFDEGLFQSSLDLHKNPTQYAQRPISDEAFNFRSSDFTMQVW